MAALAGCALVVDVHASNIYLREIPQVRINHVFAEALLPYARRMNLDVIWLHGAVTVLEATIAHSLNESGVPALSPPGHGRRAGEDTGPVARYHGRRRRAWARRRVPFTLISCPS